MVSLHTVNVHGNISLAAGVFQKGIYPKATYYKINRFTSNNEVAIQLIWGSVLRCKGMQLKVIQNV